ncbi:ABC transporter permease [Thalassovita aquimarina]|uniref:Autoinducer 2 import system permease protein LsrD n=1 Tax=Thalassovita aquimarina TaxID=2785917 RepID=A0ABS5HUR7_9RHOB|nr:ABC transporter permease [Thalassovita aquimarina]MBR9652712.1 ABC transporter permease [Thalassovita aquimarina]
MTDVIQAPTKPSAARRMLRTIAHWPPAFWGLIAVLLLAAFTQPHFLSVPFLMILLRQAAPLGIVALGQTFTIANRSLDLSVGAVIMLVNILVSDRIFLGFPAVIPISVALLAGVAVGLINGLLITVLRASAVVVTLGTASVVTGIGYLISGGAPGNAMSDTIKYIGRGRIELFPVSGLFWIASAIIAWIILRKLVFGRFIMAAGDNPSAAHYSGIPVTRTLLVSHIMSGVFAALGGLILSGLIGVGSLGLGADYVLSSIAAVILGGAVFGGGAGGAVGTVLGTMLLIMILNLLTVFGIDEAGKLVVQGLVIAVAAIIYQKSAAR